ncbi:FAS1-like dehydratase domain-containing protein [Roseateles violae]|uniref:MaoC family dehydratase N-terminal domain-containing protein n=1 Tax=Roseateles violae TaxID=3058042 RepID=A0ABT8DU05_9BURK|nr:MaoC family dehydratase N-terminal domain-containing protein [Pelomonas sp. PFR6]MDN3921483.1 MaoC family dehydratase N-terminal domain-containing protein [Pelomonas sp. PFR6]
MTDSTDTPDLSMLRSFVGASMQSTDTIDPFPARALAAALGCDALPADGDALGPTGHWLYFHDTPTRAATGVDGHPLRGGFLPPVPLQRRMWAAGRIAYDRPIRIGLLATRRSTIASVELKQGRGGPLVFVAVDHVVEQEGQRCLSERQDIVYLDRPDPSSPPRAEAGPALPESELLLSLRPDPVLLFRYSALSYNSHRIHYDQAYATQQEGYPGLVVHGPLLATLLADAGARRMGARPIASFGFRALRPSFVDAMIELRGRPSDDAMALWSTDGAGNIAMSAELRVRA